MEEEPLDFIDCDVMPHPVVDIEISTPTSEGELKQPYRCNKCDYATRHSSHFKRHKLVHSGLKPFKCNVCSFAFSQLGHLKAHKLIHSGEKPYKCSLCDFSCNKLSNLKRHKLVHCGEYRATCKQTEQWMNYDSSLEENFSTRISETHHRCIDCDYFSKSVFGLRKHLLQHREATEF